jgi:phospholipid/cholesterol/gamma-HCH transport system substrate-binding protein
MIKMRTVEIAVGALIIAGIASLLMLALQVSGLSNFYEKDTGYKVYAHFENIGGLKIRAKVSVAGVVVGRVCAIELDPTSFNAKVTLCLDADRADKFPADSQVSIMTAGLLGDNYIALVPGFNEGEYLAEGSNIPVENTHSALILEKLISRFLANQVSGDQSKNKTKSEAQSEEETGKSKSKSDHNQSSQGLSEEKVAAEKVAEEKMAGGEQVDKLDKELAEEKMAAEKIVSEKIAAEKIAAEKIAAEKLTIEPNETKARVEEKATGNLPIKEIMPVTGNVSRKSPE